MPNNNAFAQLYAFLQNLSNSLNNPSLSPAGPELNRLQSQTAYPLHRELNQDMAAAHLPQFGSQDLTWRRGENNAFNKWHHSGIPASPALIHDYLAQSGGAERVVAALHTLFPSAPVYTSVFDPAATLACFSQMDVRTSFLQRSWLASRRFHKFALAYYPTAFEAFDLTEHDLVISSSSSFAKGVITRPETCHICYCHTPARFAWRQHEYFQQGRLTRLLSPFMRGMISDLRRWDIDSAQRVDYFVANSGNVAQRIRKHYRREVDAVIYPPVETRRFAQAPADEIGDHFLVVSRLVGYKRIDLAIEACNRLQLPLRIIGTGPEEKSLRQIAGPTVQFLGGASDTQVAAEYSRCKALIFPGEEDFGITPLECIASGRPVIAYRGGGALETVSAGKTGIFFNEQTVDSVAQSLLEIRNLSIQPAFLQEEAFKFDTSVFMRQMKKFTEETLERHRLLYPKMKYGSAYTRSNGNGLGQRRPLNEYP